MCSYYTQSDYPIPKHEYKQNKEDVYLSQAKQAFFVRRYFLFVLALDLWNCIGNCTWNIIIQTFSSDIHIHFGEGKTSLRGLFIKISPPPPGRKSFYPHEKCVTQRRGRGEYFPLINPKYIWREYTPPAIPSPRNMNIPQSGKLFLQFPLSVRP